MIEERVSSSFSRRFDIILTSSRVHVAVFNEAFNSSPISPRGESSGNEDAHRYRRCFSARLALTAAKPCDCSAVGMAEDSADSSLLTSAIEEDSRKVYSLFPYRESPDLGARFEVDLCNDDGPRTRGREEPPGDELLSEYAEFDYYGDSCGKRSDVPGWLSQSCPRLSRICSKSEHAPLSGAINNRRATLGDNINDHEVTESPSTVRTLVARRWSGNPAIFHTTARKRRDSQRAGITLRHGNDPETTR